ncbi:hypothetical protein [Vibrio phage S4-7]|nr:hypothetical protein [Vibrio phage S4-7]
MSVKSQLCKAIKYIRDSEGLTYEQLIDCSGGVVAKSQLTAILKYDGFNVSIDTIEDVLHGLGREIEIHIFTPLEEE